MARAKHDRSEAPVAEANPSSEAAEAAAIKPAGRTEKKKRKKNKKRPYNKTKLVREALAALGNDAPNQRIQEWIETERGVSTIPLEHISNIKSTILRNSRESAGKAAEAKGSNGASERGSVTPSAKLSLQDVQMIRELIDRIGRAGVHEVVDLFR